MFNFIKRFIFFIFLTLGFFFLFTTTTAKNSTVLNIKTPSVTTTTIAVTTPTPTPTPTNFKIIYSLPNSGMMYLTFDDGYGSNYIKTVLDCLRKNNVQCTFFIIGKCLQAYPELWQQAIIDGNEICYHSMKHENLMTYTNQQILNDIATWNSTAKEILGDDYVIPKIARLPGGNGNQSQRVLKLFNNLNYNIIAWNADSYTGVIKNNKNNVFVINQQIADYVLNNANIGTIQLQHFNCYDAPAVSFYIQSLKNKYTLGKISDAIITFSSST